MARAAPHPTAVLPSTGGSFSFRAVLHRSFLVGLALVSITAAGCSDEPSRFTPSLDDAGADTGSSLDGSTPGDVEGPVDRGVIPVRDTGPNLDQTIVYAHSETVLYAVNPRTNALTRVGTFTFPRGDTNNHSMNDVAVDADGTLVGNTQDALYRIDTGTAVCSLIATLPDNHNFVGLTYLPSGVLPGTTGEVLVGGARDGTYWRIDPSTGRSTALGQLRVRSALYGLSGDFVSTAAGTFATVRAANATSGSHDQLANMNPQTGELTLPSGNTGFDGIFGLAYYRDTLYGFTRAGEFIRINIRTGVGTLVSMPSPVVLFYGAGVTTLAPTAPP